MLEKIKEIQQFWFGGDVQNPLSHASKWWKVDPALDEEIKVRFEPVLQMAAQGQLDSWLEMPQSTLAYIILLDQFSRNMYRNTPLAFAQDGLALKACEEGRDHKLDKELSIVQRLFFYLPLEHSEDLANQKLCLALMTQLVDESRQHHPEMLCLMEQALSSAQSHYDVIHNFGRFPHRNLILGRESTQEELVFLNLPNSHF